MRTSQPTVTNLGDLIAAEERRERDAEGYKGVAEILDEAVQAARVITVTPITCDRCHGEGSYQDELTVEDVVCRECRGHGVERFELRRDGLLGSLSPSRWRLDDVEHFASVIERLDDAAAIAAIEREVAP